MKFIATDTYSFERIRTSNRVYVDKTAIIHKLLDADAGVEYFMSRPRRFGKSLLVSTLRAISEGRRDLFKGLAIDAMDYDWKTYPVLHFDMTMIKDQEPEYMREGLRDLIKRYATGLDGCTFSEKSPTASWMGELIQKSAEQSPEKKVVILIDEYDAPVAGFLNKPEKLNAARDMLHDFYSALKANEKHIRFLFMTGVSKFTKLSVFSGLNNLRDISMEPEYATLLGFTPTELRENLRETIQAFADEKGMSFDALVNELRVWYNGYRFSPKSEETVLNPVSVGMALRGHEFANNWPSTGNATIIVERIRANGGLPADLNDLTATKNDLDVCDALTLPMKALLYQGGYLTIKDVDEDGVLHLGIPNKEIRESLDSGCLNAILQDRASDYLIGAIRARRMFREHRTEPIWEMLTAFFAKIPAEWRIQNEAEVKRLFLLFFSLAGADIITEAQSARGRADAVVTTADTIYVIEFKYAKTSEAALAQIREKGYAAPFADSGKKVVCIGVNFNPETRTLDAPVME